MHVGHIVPSCDFWFQKVWVPFNSATLSLDVLLAFPFPVTKKEVWNSAWHPVLGQAFNHGTRRVEWRQSSSWMRVAGLLSACDVLPDILLPVKSCFPGEAGRLGPGMRWLGCPPRLEEVSGFRACHGIDFSLWCTGRAGSVPGCVSGLHIAWAPLSHGVGGGVWLDAETKCCCSWRASACRFPQVDFSSLPCTCRQWTPWMARGAGWSAWFLFRGLGLVFFFFIYSALASASPCVEEKKEANPAGG